MSQRDVERTLADSWQIRASAMISSRIRPTPVYGSGSSWQSQEVEALLRVPRSALVSLGARLDDRICRLHIQRSEIAGQGEWEGGILGALLIAMFPAVNGYFFIPNYGSIIAAIAFDRTGTMRIGRFILSHSFMLPGLIATGGAVAIGLGIAKLFF